MASPEELILEQRTRALNLKEDTLARQARQQEITEQRLNDHQQEVAEKERSNRLKAQELSQRQHKLEEDQRLQEKEALSLAKRQQELAIKLKKNQLFLLPTLLVICIVGGYFAYDYMNQQRIQYHQIAIAAQNIDKLAALLNLTQDQVIDRSQDLQSKKIELDKTKDMLLNLRNASDQLQSEIVRLQEQPFSSSDEKQGLSHSAENLSQQLANLKIQLEDHFLTNDINEAFIDFQEQDLKVFKAAMTSYQEKLTQREGSLTAQKARQASLEDLLESSQQQNKLLTEQLEQMNTSIKQMRSQNSRTLEENKP